MVTSAEVARLAKVSRSTVSRVISGTTPVSPVKALRVWEAVKATGYEPDTIAQSLVRQRSHTIALTIFDPAHEFSFASLSRSRSYFYLDVLAGIEREAAAAGFDLALPSRAYSRFDQYLRHLQARRVAGVIMLVPPNERIQQMIQVDMPTVFIDVLGQGPCATYVKGDNVAGSKHAIQHLLELGHRRIALLTGEMTAPPAIERLLGAQYGYAEAGLTMDPTLICQAGFDRETAYAATLRLLDERRDFTAIAAQSDIMAFGALRALHERGVRVPEEVSLIGFDDIDFCLDVYPPLSTVRPEKSDMGRGAVRLLLDLIGGKPQVQPLIVPTHVVARQSTGSAPRLPA